MMNIPPSEAKALPLEEYEMLLYHWNKAHSTGDDAVPHPDHEHTQKMVDRLNAHLGREMAKA
jgi:hypothetical protein